MKPEERIVGGILGVVVGTTSAVSTKGRGSGKPRYIDDRLRYL